MFNNYIKIQLADVLRNIIELYNLRERLLIITIDNVFNTIIYIKIL